MTRSFQGSESDRTGSETLEHVRDRFDSECHQLTTQGVLSRESHVYLGCSGGGDSMALLQLTCEHASKAGWSVSVLHFDHAQREASRAESDFVGRHCLSMGLPFISERMESVFIDSRGDEGSLRQARYDFFARQMATVPHSVLFLAHHGDDQAETLLMRLMRGSGPTGLGAIRQVEAVFGLTVVRPLLRFRRSELHAYLSEKKLEWVEDPSNEDGRFKRAWVRHDLLPMMNARMEMDLTPRLIRTASLIQEEAQALVVAARLLLGLIEIAAPAGALAALDLNHSFWKEANPELQRSLLRRWLWDIRKGDHPPGFEAVREVLTFIERGTPGLKLRTVERIQLCKEDGCLIARPEVK